MEKEEFLRLLPRLIREDDEVKGAIVSALSSVMATKNDIEKVIEHSDKRFEAMQKQMDDRFEKVINKTNYLGERQLDTFALANETLQLIKETVIPQLKNLNEDFPKMAGAINNLKEGQNQIVKDIYDLKKAQNEMSGKGLHDLNQ